MSFRWIILGRFSKQGAQSIAEHGMQAAHDAFAAAIAQPPANGTITSWYAVDSHDWDVAIIGQVDTPESSASTDQQPDLPANPNPKGTASFNAHQGTTRSPAPDRTAPMSSRHPQVSARNWPDSQPTYTK